MKLLFENWRRYTNSLLNEDLLIESLEEAEASVLKRATKLFKGWVFENDNKTYQIIEKKVEQSKIDNIAWYERQKAKGRNDDELLERLSNYVYSWEIGGYLVLSIIKKYMVPHDITEQQKKIALLWNYKKIVEGKIPDIKQFFNSILFYIAEYRISVRKYELDIDNFNQNHFIYIDNLINYQKRNTWSDVDTLPKSLIIELYYRYINFIRDGKKDLNSVVDYDELYELIQEARPLYMAWQEKQENKDAKEEMLLNNEDWEIKILLNKSAARILGKNSNLCTAAPGLNYFDKYSKANDPLIGITNKKANKRYQFNFGEEDFKYLRPFKENEKVCFEQTPLDKKELEEIMKVLVKVVPEKYTIAYNYLQGYYGE